LDFQFNPFLIDDERPALFYTRMYAMCLEVQNDHIFELAGVQHLGDDVTDVVVSTSAGGMRRFLDLGQHKLRVLETPHVHHWDSMMLFEEKTKSVFPSDLFIQPGDQPQW
jgi:hypothetical protein